MPVFRRLLSALLLAIPFLAARENAYAHVPAPVTLHRATITAGECLGDLSGWKTEHRQPIPEQTGHSLIAPFTGTLDLSGLTGKKTGAPPVSVTKKPPKTVTLLPSTFLA
ncbi:hypothetical protein NB643_05215 [Oxalobacter aliiformigenes]|uniref:Uncharacterized protein n=1 Tax=Oxalobacter aliiformigenes TaxID=2946593 RepID=A0ABY7JNR8_9BURK|nr:hypothetical protein [Oxalobacter aliiformigenes]WAV92340.1 hypothetical protein NB641_05885 [Oxalobacter aliiformigenes]WAV96148.1 hypothetical protein NB643_05215 [Oxalobacter aliiformigenes]WAV97935.1 hypothetical protein NB645_04195 [Oxalobacter aliiformigenes]